MASINIYTADYTRVSDDFHFDNGLMFTNRKAAQRDCDKMNKIHDDQNPDNDRSWRYIVHKHIAFSF